jgi:hypothetical protein
MDQPLLNAERNRLQILTATWPENAFATFDEKQCAVRRALNQLAFAVEKLIFEPVQLDPSMWTAVPIYVNLSVTLNRKHTVVAELEALGAIFADVVDVT